MRTSWQARHTIQHGISHRFKKRIFEERVSILAVVRPEERRDKQEHGTRLNLLQERNAVCMRPQQKVSPRVLTPWRIEKSGTADTPVRVPALHNDRCIVLGNQNECISRNNGTDLHDAAECRLIDKGPVAQNRLSHYQQLHQQNGEECHPHAAVTEALPENIETDTCEWQQEELELQEEPAVEQQVRDDEKQTPEHGELPDGPALLSEIHQEPDGTYKQHDGLRAQVKRCRRKTARYSFCLPQQRRYIL